MKTFIRHDLPKLNRETVNGVRVYNTPTGEKYPSVTTVTGFGNKKELMEWWERVGDEEANAVSRRAAGRGTRLHKHCEDYMLGEEVDVNMFDIELWKQFKSQLDHIDNVRCIEDTLYSHKLKVAGTVDLIAEYKGVISIIDWKTSIRVKTLNEVEGYLMQCAAYAECFEEMIGITIDQLVVIIGTDESVNPVVFVENKTYWLKKFKQKRYLYYKYYKL